MMVWHTDLIGGLGAAMAREKVRAKETQNYFAYLLRLWRESGGDLPRDESTRWRASLQDPHSGERVGFASLEELFSFLRRETANERFGSQLEESR
jgi:hypothetical protein